MVAAISVFTLIDEKIETNKGKKSLENIEGNIEFKNVSFSYNEEKSPIKNFNLVINRNETIAIVGSTGSGKTTLVNLLARFYKPTKGETLSGGQRQRLSIARAIAKDSPILILDEATSSLDSATEKLVQSSINKMRQGRTTIIIAHRLSTIQNADRIIVLKNGEIVEQ